MPACLACPLLPMAARSNQLQLHAEQHEVTWNLLQTTLALSIPTEATPLFVTSAGKAPFCPRELWTQLTGAVSARSVRTVGLRWQVRFEFVVATSRAGAPWITQDQHKEYACLAPQPRPLPPAGSGPGPGPGPNPALTRGQPRITLT